MQKTSLIIFLTMIFCSHIVGQYSNIEVPTLDAVNTFEHVDLHIPILLGIDEDREATVIINGKKIIELDSVEVEIINCYKKLYYNPPSASNTKSGLNYYDVQNIMNTIPELIVDQNCRMEDFENLRSELQLLSFHTSILSAKSSVLSRIESIWTTGMIYEMNPLDVEGYNARRKKDGKLPKKKKVIFQLVTSSIAAMYNPPKINDIENVPPPPPPSLDEKARLVDQIFRDSFPYFYTSVFDEEILSINTYHINIHADHIYSFQDYANLTIEEVTSSIVNTPIDKKTFFIISYDKNAVYEDYVKLYRVINDYIFIERETYCQENFYTSYIQLSPSERDIVNAKIPFNLIEKKYYDN